MANGKAKGSGFEREISKTLSLWWSEGKDDSLFWRTQNSGGRFTVRKKVGLQTEGQSGDIASTSPLSKHFTDTFNVELKAYKNINLWSAITGSKGTLVDWWNKLQAESIQEDKIPLLIVKENFKPILLFSNPMLSIQVDDICKPDNTYFIPSIDFRFDHFNGVIHGFLFDAFLALNVNRMKEMCKEHSAFRERTAKYRSK